MTIVPQFLKIFNPWHNLHDFLTCISLLESSLMVFHDREKPDSYGGGGVFLREQIKIRRIMCVLSSFLDVWASFYFLFFLSLF